MPRTISCVSILPAWGAPHNLPLQRRDWPSPMPSWTSPPWTRSGPCPWAPRRGANEIERFDDHVVAATLDRIGPEFIASYPCHVIPACVAGEVGFAGVNMTIPTACAAGNYAIAYACDVLRAGRADVMLAGGADAFSRITYTGFARLGAIAPDICQPFDRNRKGMVPGEGAAVLVLEPSRRRSPAAPHLC